MYGVSLDSTEKTDRGKHLTVFAAYIAGVKGFGLGALLELYDVGGISQNNKLCVGAVKVVLMLKNKGRALFSF